MTKFNLTPRFIASRKPAAAGRRDDYMDAVVPGLALRVTERGHKSFVLVARYPLNPGNPTRRLIGADGAVTLAHARDKARHWLTLIARGVDPKIEEARANAAALRSQHNSFGSVAERFLSEKASTWAKSNEARRTIQSEFVSRWRDRPIAEIMPDECSAAVRAISARGAPYQAHNAFGYLRSLFNWAIGIGSYGLMSSPLDRLKPADVVGAKRESRERNLNDAELRAVWDVADQMGYPYGPLFRFLILTGQRENEVAGMRWREVDLDKALWTIPAARMKGRRAHEVPLCPMAIALLHSLPRLTKGDHVFTTTAGEKPVNGFSKAKVRIDALIVAKASDGAEPMPHWVIHDLRRTVRTHLSALPVQDIVRELVIAHAKKGLHKVYDLHAYSDEKRECLRLWEARLSNIISPKRADVVALPVARRRA